MLTPCQPCVCPGAACEQCYFGYHSDETNHELMKEKLLAYLADGEKAPGWRAAAAYMVTHPNWRTELGMEPEVKGEKENNAMKTLRSVKVTLDPNELTKMIRDYLAKEGLEVCDVEFTVGSHVQSGIDDCRVYTFDGCEARCRLTTERQGT